jgi:hypothetical protein
MGADWGGLGCTATSSNMRLGNEHCRYLFWSTCQSLQVFNGQSPNRTWDAANLGLRMIFGFEGNSYDNANYGNFFWQEWNNNKSFSTAWLDSSWRISSNQSPTVVACGATQHEAQDRLFNERNFFDGAASKNWWWWRWYTSAAARDVMTSLPAQLQSADLAPAHLSAQALFDRFEMGGEVAADGSASFNDGDRALTRSSDGSFSVRLAHANLSNTKKLSAASARAVADRVIDRLALRGESHLVLDRLIHAEAAGATNMGSGEIVDHHNNETIVQYRQMIDGVPVISPDAGTLRVAIDNDGNPTRVEGALRQITQLHSQGRQTPPQQPEPEGRKMRGHSEELSPEATMPHEVALERATAQRLRAIVAKGAGLTGFTTIPGTTEIGYTVKGDSAQLIATKSIEVDFGGGYRKLYRIEAPIFG